MRRAFTLVELLISIMLLGIGLTCVASLFPVAGALQRTSFDDSTAKQVGKSAHAAIHARGFGIPQIDTLMSGDAQRLIDYQSGRVITAPQFVLDPAVADPPPGYPAGAFAAAVRWYYEDRSFPSHTPIELRTFFWVPLLQGNDIFPNHLRVFLFVLKNDHNIGYNPNPPVGVDVANPEVFPMPRVLAMEAVADSVTRNSIYVTPPAGVRPSQVFQVGDQILGNLGNIYRIRRVSEVREGISTDQLPVAVPVGSGSLQVDQPVAADITKVWYAQRASRGGPSPTVFIVPPFTVPLVVN